MSSLTISITVIAVSGPECASATVSQRIFGVPGWRSARKFQVRSASAARSAGAVAHEVFRHTAAKKLRHEIGRNGAVGAGQRGAGVLDDRLGQAFVFATGQFSGHGNLALFGRIGRGNGGVFTFCGVASRVRQQLVTRL